MYEQTCHTTLDAVLAQLNKTKEDLQQCQAATGPPQEPKSGTLAPQKK